jgi:hypothetical protein
LRHNFRQALKSWVTKTLEIATVDDIFFRERFIWIDDEPGRKSRHPSPIAYWSHRLFERASSSAQWSALKSAAASWEGLHEHLDTLVGTVEHGAMRVELRSLAQSFLPKPRYDAASKTFNVPHTIDEFHFDSKYSHLVEAVASQDIRYEVRIVLVGLELSDDAFPFPLSQDMVIDKLETEEIQELGEMGILPSEFGSSVSDLYDWDGTPRFVVLLTQKFKKRLGPAAFAPCVTVEAKEAVHGLIESLLMAFALLKQGEVLVGPTITKGIDWAQGVSYSNVSVPRRFDRSRDMRLDKNDCARLKPLFRNLNEDPQLKSGPLGVALRRLMYSMERSRPEDRFLDDMIAAEALFGDSSAKTEVGYRLAIRAAFALQPVDREKRRKIFDAMRIAYNVRSTIAHGSLPKPKDLMVNGHRVQLSEFVGTIEDFVRAAAASAVLLHGREFLPDNWDDYIIGAKVPYALNQSDKRVAR